MAMKRYRVNDTSLRSWRRTRQQPPGNAIIAHNEGVDLLPSNIELSGMEGCENGIWTVLQMEKVLTLPR